LSSGVIGSILALVISNLREDKEKEVRKNARALVPAELATVRDFLKRMLDDLKDSVLHFLPLVAGSTEVTRGERIIQDLEFQDLDTEIKLKAFDASELREMHDVYTQILTLHTFRTAGIGDAGAIVYGGGGHREAKPAHYSDLHLPAWLTIRIISKAEEGI
jgi:hypothetical protein